MAGGRPSKYRKKYAQMLIDFFDIPKTLTIEIPHYKYNKDGVQQLHWTDKRIIANEYPKFHKFATSIGVHRESLINWTKEKGDDEKLANPEFFDAYMHAKELQKEFLIENGLNGYYNPAAFVFTAKNITDMRDKKEVDLSTLGEKIENSVFVVPSFGSDNSDKDASDNS